MRAMRYNEHNTNPHPTQPQSGQQHPRKYKVLRQAGQVGQPVSGCSNREKSKPVCGVRNCCAGRLARLMSRRKRPAWAGCI